MRQTVSRLLALAALLLAVPACAQRGRATGGVPVAKDAPSYQLADTAALRRALDSVATAHRGVLGYSVINLETGERLSARGDEPFPTASVVKVPVLVALYDLVEKKRISLDDPIAVLKVDQVGGSGVLQHLHNGAVVTVGDAARLMIIISDNTATNLILDKVGIRTVWQKMEALGLPRTKIHAKSFNRATSLAMDSSVKYGLGVSTPNEMARLFELLGRGQAVSPAADSAMLAILALNEDDTKLGRYTGGIRSARKSGDVDASRADCALFWRQSRVVVCAFTRENQDRSYAVDAEAHLAIARIGQVVATAWPAPPRPPAPAAP